MREVTPNLYVGTTDEASHTLMQQDDWRLVNVAKTLHLELHRWLKPDRNSPYYIIHETSHWISVNWVDSPDPRFFNYLNNGIKVVEQVLAFIQKSLEEGKKVLITCDQGQSRSPSVALLYLAKVSCTLPDTSFREASIEFSKIYPAYKPAIGISSFLTENWSQI